MIDRAIGLGITNGDDLDEPMRRRHMAVMVVRALNNPNMDADAALEIAINSGIYNGKYPETPITREEMMLMCSSMLGLRDHDNDELSIQRLINSGVSGGTRRKDIGIRRE